jgi:hypothetical protein
VAQPQSAHIPGSVQANVLAQPDDRITRSVTANLERTPSGHGFIPRRHLRTRRTPAHRSGQRTVRFPSAPPVATPVPFDPEVFKNEASSNRHGCHSLASPAFRQRL